MKKTIFLLALILPVCSLLAQPYMPIPIPLITPLPNLPTPEFVNDDDKIQLYQLGEDNVVTIIQDGENNQAVFTTFGNDNEVSDVYQEGTRNYSYVLQGGFFSFADGNSAVVNQVNTGTNPGNVNLSSVYQTGDNNDAIVSQVLDAHPDYADAYGSQQGFIRQRGNENEATQYQEGMRNRALTTQAGINGVANQYQGGSPYINGKSAFGSGAVIIQNIPADGAKAHQHQAGMHNDALIIQSTDNSVAGQIQYSKEDTYNSNARDNIGRITQLNPWFGNGDGNHAVQVQVYDGVKATGNVANTLQIGSDNQAWQVQLGGNNQDVITQIGSGNYGATMQINGASMPTAVTIPAAALMPWPL